LAILSNDSALNFCMQRKCFSNAYIGSTNVVMCLTIELKCTSLVIVHFLIKTKR
jgi:hypothetical protein